MHTMLGVKYVPGEGFRTTMTAAAENKKVFMHIVLRRKICALELNIIMIYC